MIRSVLSCILVAISFNGPISFAESHGGGIRPASSAHHPANGQKPINYFIKTLGDISPFSDARLKEMASELINLQSAAGDQKLEREIPKLITQRLDKILASIKPDQLEISLKRVTAEVNMGFSLSRGYREQELALLKKLRQALELAVRRKNLGQKPLAKSPGLSKDELREWLLGEWIRVTQLSWNPQNSTLVQQWRSYLHQLGEKRLGLRGNDLAYETAAIEYARGKSRYRIIRSGESGSNLLVVNE